MKTRIITSFVFAAFGIPLLIFSEYIIYAIAVGAFAAIAMYEMMGLTGFRWRLPICIPTYLLAISLPIGAYFAKENIAMFGVSCLLLAMAYLFYFFGYAVLKKGRVPFGNVASHFTTMMYIVMSFTALSLVRYITHGVYCFVIVFLASWMSDVFAYFVGRAFGKHKLIPEVSPKKTVEGAIGGVVFATVGCVIYGLVVSFIDGAPAPNYLMLALLGIILSVVSQFGDLIASLIKRECGVKDYGSLFPGHGGVLDRFDSIIAVSPVLLAICLLFPPFG